MKIRVRVILFGKLKHLLKKTEFEMEVREGIVPAQVVRELNLPEKIFTFVAINYKRVDLETKLKNGDRLFLSPLLAGG